MSFRNTMFYIGFFVFFFVVGGIVGSQIYKDTANIFLISGFIVAIIGMLIGRFVINLINP